ncbi:hypothetical protein [Vannielia litorea]|uniref:hypothetical protein n=1 Tax=Vannielia litorea TaxID=1217970 RepID=UPI00111534F6|nr:hypothetical protein [Vannielia litorea]
MDITFVIEGELQDKGGLVTLVFRPGEASENDETEVDIHLAARSNLVIVDLPKGAEMAYRFRTKSKSGITTDRFAVGSFRQGEGKPDAEVLEHHVDAQSGWTVSDSRRISALVNLHDRSAYSCVEHANLQICDTSSVMEGGAKP